MEISHVAGLISAIVAVYGIAIWFIVTRTIVRSIRDKPKAPETIRLIIVDEPVLNDTMSFSRRVATCKRN